MGTMRPFISRAVRRTEMAARPWIRPPGLDSDTTPVTRAPLGARVTPAETSGCESHASKRWPERTCLVESAEAVRMRTRAPAGMRTGAAAVVRTLDWLRTLV